MVFTVGINNITYNAGTVQTWDVSHVANMTPLFPDAIHVTRVQNSTDMKIEISLTSCIKS